MSDPSESASCGAEDEATERVNFGVEVPRPNVSRVSSQKKLVASPVKVVPFANCTAPVPPAAEVEPPVERQVLSTAKQPSVMLRPFAKVEVAVPVCAKFKTESPPEKVEVALPCTVRKPVVVAPPETKSPVACPPAPRVVEPVAKMLPPWIKPLAEKAVDDAYGKTEASEVEVAK